MIQGRRGRFRGRCPGGEPLDIELGGAALALLDALDQTNTLLVVQLGQQLHGLVPSAAHIPAYLVHGVVDIDAPVIVIAAIFRGQAHAVQQHTIEQLGVCGNVLEFLICDQQARDFEINKFLRFLTVEIVR